MNYNMTFYKRIIFPLLFGVALLCNTKLMAQQEPQFTQYMYNLMSINPGYTGVNSTLDATLQSRLQWVGLSGAPQSHSLSVSSPFYDDKMGLGLSIISDKYGPINNTYITANYAYKLKLNNTLTLSMGLKAGIYNFDASLTELDASKDGTDPILQENLTKYFQPNVGIGLYLYHKDYNVGISIPKLVQTDLNSDASSQNTLADLRRHFYISGGYTYTIDKEWKIRGLLLEKIVTGSPISSEITVQGIYLNDYQGAITYRIGDAIAILLNAQVMPELMVGYSYDFNISNLSGYNSGSHEILLTYSYKQKKGVRAKSNSSYFKKRR